ncbi:hypothetical protein BN176_1520001 [Clostridioides difficile E19]|nr:hypothetical protein BN176_1520001 [Clostridioides difficile E19]
MFDIHFVNFPISDCANFKFNATIIMPIILYRIVVLISQSTI